LDKRYHAVTTQTQNYYTGDIVPPSTKSQVIRAQKFSVLYYYLMNFVFFTYSLLVPILTKPPAFGGLDLRDFHVGPPQIVVMVVVLAIPLLRLKVMSWTTEFYQLAALLLGLEIALIAFTVAWWSPGIPVLFMIFLANLLNMGVSQYYWKKQFQLTVAELEQLVPPAPPKSKDTTDKTLGVFSNFADLKEEFNRLWGFKKNRSIPVLFGERCGVFNTRAAPLSHPKALALTYMQALNPRETLVEWGRDAAALWDLNLLGLADGMLDTFITNVAFSLAGLWAGQVLFVEWGHHGVLSLLCSCSMVAIGAMAYVRTRTWLEDAVGVSVTEKEWLAHEIVKHPADREELVYDTLDVTIMPSSGKQHMTGDAEHQLNGRLNFVFMWICVASIADFIGESYLAKMYWNLSVETKSMMEALTPFNFKLYQHAKWEVTSLAIVVKSIQNLLFIMMASIFFGTYYENEELPVILMGAIGTACFVMSITKAVEAVGYSFTVLRNGNTARHKWVSEWIVLVLMIVVVTNLGIWLYFLPIMKSWNLPIGGCNAVVNQYVFPGKCKN